MTIVLPSGPVAPQEVPVDLIRAAVAARGQALVPATGTSMLPTLAPGTLVTVHATDPDDLVVGDVVAVELAGRLVVHRVVRVEGDQVVTAGDALALADPPCPRADVVGVVRGPGPRPAPARWPGPATTGRRRVDPVPIDPVTIDPVPIDPVPIDPVPIDPVPIDPVPIDPVPIDPVRVDVWVADHDGDATARFDDLSLPAGWRVHVLPAGRCGVPALVARRLALACTDRPCLAVTPNAVHPLTAVLTGGQDRTALPDGTQILLGWPLGSTGPGVRGTLVPPRLAQAHARVGALGVEVPADQALDRLLARCR